VDWSAWLDRLVAVADNLRAALDYLLATRDAARSLRLATAMEGYWISRGSRREGRDRLTTVLALPGSPAISRLRARALERTSNLARHLGNLAVAATSYDIEAVELYRVLGDRARMVRALARLGNNLNNVGDYAGARRALEEGLSIARHLGDPATLAEALGQSADSAVDQEDVDTAKALLAEWLPLARRLELWWSVAYNLWEEGRLATLLGDATRALAAYDESLAIYRQIQILQMMAVCVYGMAYLASQRGDRVNAWRLIVEGIAIGRELVVPQAIIYGLEQAAVLAVVEGQPERAARLAGAATGLRRAVQYARHPIVKTLLRRAGVPIERPTETREAAAWDAGQVLTQEQAISYALEENGA
jgi:tetratricopeptide (TPR) repeat protein